VRIIYIYILSFCLLLFGGYCGAYAGNHHTPHGYAQAQRMQKTQQAKVTITGPGVNTLTNTISSDEKRSILTVEDEDDDIAFSRKYVLLTNYFISVVYAAFLIYCCNYFTKRSHVRRQLSTVGSKYIFQGSLRI
jgi:hypothetical protein